MSPRARQVLNRLAKDHGMKVSDLIGRSRAPAVSRVRQQAYAELYALRGARMEDPHSLPRIGVIMGGRDHCTVWKGIRAHERRLAEGGGA